MPTLSAMTPVPEMTWSTGEVSELSRIWPGARFRSPPGFAANLARVRLGDVVVECLDVTPHSSVRDNDLACAGQSRAISIEVVTSGVMWRAGAAGRYLQRRGEVVISSTDEPFAFDWPDRGSLLRAVMPFDVVRARVADIGRLPGGPLTRHARVQGYVAFMTRVIDSVTDGSAVGVEYERAVWWLQLALLKDASRSNEPSGTSALRARIHDYIKVHLFEQDLSVASTARALDISVRSVHNAFNDHGTTAARSIRTARVQAVAGSLRLEDSRRLRTIAAIAGEFGFPSAEALQRAFIEEFGVRVHEYRQSLAARDA